MVVIVSTTQYPVEQEEKFSAFFGQFAFPLSPFQKHAIQALVEGHHVLITAHTGSGKTLPAEFAIRHFVRTAHKKVVYCSPIKALSNQKFYEFQQKYPDISFGLLTGDNKINPSADVLIMTTEILLNTLFLLSAPGAATTACPVEIDIQNELACVVFDEVHYINDPHRGHVWEKCMMLLPPHIQMLMLSATIDKAREFAQWVETLHSSTFTPPKKVVLASTNVRVVPLSHYAFITTTEAAFKKIKDKQVQQEIRQAINKPLLLQNATGQFQEAIYQNVVVKTLGRLNTAQIDIKRKFVLNRLLDYLKSPEGDIGPDNRDKTMLPALLFLFSRKQVEICAREITARLLDDDSKVPYTIRGECDTLLRSKLPNHQEYSVLPEYEFLVTLLEKGIGIHHSGMIPIFREMVELFISKKVIHLLIATESFAIGLDCPIKTVIFTHFQKFDGTTERSLLSHEYTQMAGRAGRRGIDKVGHVIHCNNLFKPPSSLEYRQMLSGKPERFVSKLDITGQMVLQVISMNGSVTMKGGEGVGVGVAVIQKFVENSLMNQDIETQVAQQVVVVESLRTKWEELQTHISTECVEVYVRYDVLQGQIEMASHKRRKEIGKEMEGLRHMVEFTEEGFAAWKACCDLKKKVQVETEYLEELRNYSRQQIVRIGRVLERGGYLFSMGEGVWTLTEKGRLATQLKEADGLLMAELLLDTDYFAGWTAAEMVAVLSCFCEVRKGGEEETQQGVLEEEAEASIIRKMRSHIEWMERLEGEEGVRLNHEAVFIQTVLYSRMEEWVQATNREACAHFLQHLLEDCDVGVGDFVKVILKITAIKKELERTVLNVPFQHVLSQIDELICKYVATSQSLYL